jgi:hypothetical protein
MFSVPAIFAGADFLALLWVALVLVWSLWTVRLARRVRFARVRQVLRGQHGLSYTLAFVLTMPIYLLTCLMIGEVTLLLMTKVGTVYAAYAGARSAAVWEAMDPALKDKRIRQAVVNGMAPFAMSGEMNVAGPAGIPSADDVRFAGEYVTSLALYSRLRPNLGTPTGIPDGDVETVAAYLESHGPNTGRKLNVRRVLAHYVGVAARTKYAVEIPVRKHGEKVTCEVTYRAPFITPGVGRLLDPDGSWPYEFPVSSKVTLTLELPKSSDGTLGIAYRSF